jgi:hypothetical protein
MKGETTMTTTVEKKLNALFEELVPASGKADTVAGEIVRAITRIGYRNWNDGDHIGVGYGKETCNPAARYLSAKCGEAVNAAIDAIWGDAYDERYDKGLAALEQAVLDWLEEHPELRTEENAEDMWSYRDPEEDTDDENEEDDW